MSLEKSEARIKSRIWQAIAQDDVDLPDIPKEKLETLIDLVTDAALLELDENLSTSTAEMRTLPDDMPDPADGVEELIWEGRPFLSITTYYTVTDERIRVTEGLLGKTHADIELVRVQSMDQKQTAGERMLKVGDITIRSHDPKNPVIVLNNVRNPTEVYELLRRAVLNARNRHGLTYREEM